MTQEIMGTAEIGAWLGVTRQEVAQWKFQGKLPSPDYQLKATPVWKQSTLLEWRESNTWVENRVNSAKELVNG
tara:strand:+ start:463 stop:681 length:219 start_codon:yes stop_codon:yes gene_type:complete